MSTAIHPADINRLKAARFHRPDYIPMVFHINDACWHHMPQQGLVDLMASHELLFPDFAPFELPYEPVYALNARADQPFTDPWGCVWESTDNGITGTVTGHPLGDWAAFETFTPPEPSNDPLGHYLDSAVARASGSRRLTEGGLRHGHTFLQLCDLRGYENLMFDMHDGDARLGRLIKMVERYNLALVQQALHDGVMWMQYPEDLGMQWGPLIAPEHFRRYIRPSYRRLMTPSREAGCVVHMHCDGQLHAVIDDLLECPIDVLNLQDLVNGLDWIEKNVKGRTAIELDIDRQSVTVHGTPDAIDELIRDGVAKLGSRDGGLMLIYGLYPGTPLENAFAVADAMERYAGYYGD